jgi:hypothetical protein
MSELHYSAPAFGCCTEQKLSSAGEPYEADMSNDRPGKAGMSGWNGRVLDLVASHKRSGVLWGARRHVRRSRSRLPSQ